MTRCSIGPWVIAAGVASGCTSSPHLATGPIQLGETPVIVRFAKPAPANDWRWELCYEFSLPGDSQHADQITAVLFTTTGRRHGFLESEIDRRGESVVCRVGKISVMTSDVPSELIPGNAEYQAVQLSSKVPLTLRALSGGQRR